MSAMRVGNALGIGTTHLSLYEPVQLQTHHYNTNMFRYEG
jgi:hypothetical protein